MTLTAWKKLWRQVQTKGHLTYSTEVITDTDLLLPVQAEVIKYDDQLVFIHLRNRVIQESRSEALALISHESEMGFWRYNRLDDRWSWSDYCYELILGKTKAAAKAANELDLLQFFSDTTLDKLQQKLDGALDENVGFSMELELAEEQETLRLELSGHTTSNELQTVYTLGILQKIDDQQSPKDLEALAHFSLDQASDMIFWMREDGSIAYANARFLDRLGYTRAQLNQLRTTDFVVEEESAAEKQALWEQLKREQTRKGELELRDSQGELLPVFFTSSFIEFEEESLACVTVQDRSGRQDDQRQLEMMQLSTEQSKDLIFWSQPDGSFAYVNPATVEKLGYSRAEYAKMQVRQIAPYADEAYLAEFWATIRKEKNLEGEFILTTREGQKLLVWASVSYVNYGGEEYAVNNLRDISKQAKIDRQRRLSEFTLENATDCVLWLGNNFHVRYLNQALLQHLGGSKEDWVGQPMEKVFAELEEDDLYGQSSREIQLPSRSGKTIYLELNFGQIKFDGDDFFAVTGRDITDAYLRRKELEVAKDKIESLSKRLQEENVVLRQESQHNYDINNIITVSPAYRSVLNQIGQVADTDTTVLILGETGTGKELLARAVHNLSEREDQPLIKVNCAALPATLIESELFGHEKGAFTGAHNQKKGRFEVADGGSIFLDEIGEVPLELQPKLLRVLQEGKFERLGGTEVIKVDVRLIAATNRNLENMVAEGKFRADLYYRLNVFPIINLPLRERTKDIPVLVQHFARKFAKQQGKEIEEIDAADLARLEKYDFPGNVRELENIVERAVVLCRSKVLAIPLDLGAAKLLKDESLNMPTFEEMQRAYIIKALQQTGGRITGAQGAGRLLGLNDRTLMSKMRKFKIEKREYLN
ncbi:MAG: sigma 54-interacting transcriptional regulator [Bacteroidota bacterium]